MKTKKTKAKRIQIGGHRVNSKDRYTYALVSIEDYERIARYKWSIHSAGYAYRLCRKTGDTKMIYLHREIMKLKPGKGVVDHISGDPLDCRRENLRVLSSNAHNLQNRMRSSGSSKYRGVYMKKQSKKWVAQVLANGKHYYGGIYDKEQEAALAAEALRRKYMPYARPDKKLISELGKKLNRAVLRQATQMGI